MKKIFNLHQHENCKDCLRCKLLANDEYINDRIKYLSEYFMCDANIFIEIMSTFMKRGGIKLFHCNCDKLAIALGNVVYKTVYSPSPLLCGRCKKVDCRCANSEYYGFRINSELAAYAYMSLEEFNELEVVILKALNFDVSVSLDLDLSVNQPFLCKSNINTQRVPNEISNITNEISYDDMKCNESMDIDL